MQRDAAALETLRLASALVVEMRQRGSQCSRVSWRKPLPSAPSTSASGRVSAARLQRLIAFLGKPDAQVAALAEFGESLRKILDEHDGHDVERAARGLGERAVRGRAVPLGQTEARCAEGGGRAERGADIMRVGDLIEHDEDAIGIGLVEPDGRQLLDLERDSLMHLVGAEQPVEIARRGVLDAHVRALR